MVATTERRLVVNADDFGYTTGVTRGIVEAHEAGAVTSTSLIVNLYALDEALASARAHPALSIGLHLNLVQGEPFERVPSLTDARSGTFHSLPTLLRLGAAGRIDREEVTAECSAQFARVRNSGVHVTHLDGHMHAHLVPGVFVPAMEVAVREGVTVVRWPRERLSAYWWDVPATLKRLAVNTVLTRAGRLPLGLRTTDHFIGVALQGGSRFDERLLATLDALEPGSTELMTHAGRVDARLMGVDSYTWERERELAALTSPRIRARLERGDIRLCTFAQIRATDA